MAGLLDFEDPNTVGALQFGMGLLNAGGPSRMPVSVGQGVAQAGSNALDAMRQARGDQRQNQMRELQMQELKRKTLQAQMMEAAKQKILNDPATDPRLKQYVEMGGDISKLFDPTTVAEGGKVTVPGLGMMGGNPVIAEGMPKVQKPMDRTRQEGTESVFENYDPTTGKWVEVSRGPKFNPKGDGSGERPFFQFLPTPEGIVTGNARTGALSMPTLNGKPVIKSQDSPTLQGKIAEAKKEGADTGEQKAQLAIKQGAVESIGEAKQMLSKGIYAGAWGPAMKSAAKFIPGYDKTKAANTEAFISHIGNVVVPRLKEFGGNDSNEELKYLKGITGGDISLEPKALEVILDSAEKKMKRNVQRLQGVSKDSGWRDL